MSDSELSSRARQLSPCASHRTPAPPTGATVRHRNAQARRGRGTASYSELLRGVGLYPRYAWNALRATVMASTPHRDGRPELEMAAFDTAALQSLADPADHMDQITESLKVFAAMSRLPGSQLDVMVLRQLLKRPPETLSALLGVPLATVRSDERHATRFLQSVLCPPPPTEGNTP